MIRNKIALLLLSAVLLAGCSIQIGGTPPIQQMAETGAQWAPCEYPIMNLPMSMRQKNWLGPQGSGSCVHASLTMLFRWQGRYAMAEHWKSTYADGEYSGRCAQRLTKEGVRFAQTTKGDVKFLEWACRTRRGCMVTCMNGAHMVCLVHFDHERAGILDNNNIGKIKWLPREQFIKEWHASYGWAATPVYTPAPPVPQVNK